MEKTPDDKNIDRRENVSGSITGGARITGDKNTIGQKVSITTNGGSYIGGNINVAGGDFVGRDKIYNEESSVNEVAQLFKKIYSIIDTKPEIDEDDRNDLRIEVQELATEVAKGDQADEYFLKRRLRIIGRMDTDILEILLTTLSAENSRLSMVIRKVAASMK